MIEQPLCFKIQLEDSCKPVTTKNMQRKPAQVQLVQCQQCFLPSCHAALLLPGVGTLHGRPEAVNILMHVLEKRVETLNQTDRVPPLRHTAGNTPPPLEVAMVTLCVTSFQLSERRSQWRWWLNCFDCPTPRRTQQDLSKRPYLFTVSHRKRLEIFRLSGTMQFENCAQTFVQLRPVGSRCEKNSVVSCEMWNRIVYVRSIIYINCGLRGIRSMWADGWEPFQNSTLPKKNSWIRLHVENHHTNFSRLSWGPNFVHPYATDIQRQ